jgi:Spy/CpxP family protein refolding chaperone
MKMNRKWIGWTLGVLALCGTLSAASAVNDALDATDANSTIERGEGFWQRMRARHGAQRRALVRLVQKLGLSDAQCGLALQESRNTQPIVEQARREAARILIDAEDAGKSGRSSDVRERLKILRQQTFRKIEPMARQVVAALTPEQRQMIEAEASKHGRSFDEERFVRRTAFLLARPMTAALLEARLGR